MAELVYPEESYAIVGHAMKVWKVLGYGLREKIYERALCIEFLKNGVPYRQQREYRVLYDGQDIGDYICDLIAFDKIVLELKTCPLITNEHLAQSLTYLKVTRLKLCLILNFGPNGLEHKRVLL